MDTLQHQLSEQLVASVQAVDVQQLTLRDRSRRAAHVAENEVWRQPLQHVYVWMALIDVVADDSLAWQAQCSRRHAGSEAELDDDLDFRVGREPVKQSKMLHDVAACAHELAEPFGEFAHRSLFAPIFFLSSFTFFDMPPRWPSSLPVCAFKCLTHDLGTTLNGAPPYVLRKIAAV